MKDKVCIHLQVRSKTGFTSQSSESQWSDSSSPAGSVLAPAMDLPNIKYQMHSKAPSCCPLPSHIHLGHCTSREPGKVSESSCCLRVCLWKVLPSPEISPREINSATQKYWPREGLSYNETSLQVRICCKIKCVFKKRAKNPSAELDHVSVVVWPNTGLCVREILVLLVLQAQNFRQHFKLMQQEA